MAFYLYKGRRRDGALVEGKVKAATKEEAKEKAAQKKQLSIQSVSKLEGVLYQDIDFFKRVTSKDMVMFLRQMTTLLQSGISLVDSVRLLANQSASNVLRSTLTDVEQDLRQGTSLSQACEKHRTVFSAMIVNMIRAGEAAGNLDEIFERLAAYFEKQHRTKQKVISAVAYPATLAAVSLAVVSFLLAVVVPSFAGVFAGFGAELPLITRVVLGAGEWMQSWFWLIVLLFAAALIAWKWMSRRPETKYYRDYLLLKTPVIGKILQKSALARMARTWSSLFASSVPVLQATSIVERIVGNEVLAGVIRSSRNSLERGRSIAEPMAAHWIFPPLVSQMVTVGEKTGALDQMLEKVAEFYEEEVDQAAERLKSLLEPLLIVILSVVVGVIVASIAIPMFEIFDTIG
ncbi:type II secretion system F family protein [Salisediminibacterium halotolerans]|uniref:type II secretion system F family protein n=1 Tax=Salisediminibacterium halotolerans TaxID=517425 RepID=UPI000EB511FF|nr:type II secretion system F family protein [Salisediminibacterium halotolerans]RLJ78231.1 type IV pilus assembly protein PilC [Actinophytocola xinjiangensis]RPE88430.1 type IV pilus assembly protein PilC [Salisediminibacterium halotolerans]TWG37208.1 type IV pilus assembly protein PilC [Salisediminibacterium halotolerans]GEL07142.1 phytochrome sensor protein [Salisediminibacterium halotolerans]